MSKAPAAYQEDYFVHVSQQPAGAQELKASWGWLYGIGGVSEETWKGRVWKASGAFPKLPCIPVAGEGG